MAYQVIFIDLQRFVSKILKKIDTPPILQLIGIIPLKNASHGTGK